MLRKKAYRGCSFGIAVGIIVLAVLLLVEGTGAVPVEEWNKTFGGSGYDVAESVQQTSDNGYIIAGSTQSFSAGSDAWLIKTDINGNEQWNKTFGGSSGDYASNVQQISDDSYVLAGGTASYGIGNGNASAWLIKTDVNSKELWNKTFGGGKGETASFVQQTSDGGYILAGQTQSYGQGSMDAWLIKTDSSGKEQWNRTFGGKKDDFAYAIQQTSDGGYIVIGGTSCGDGRCDVWLIKTDINGKEQWSRTFGGNGYNIGYSVHQTSDGGYVIAGSKQSQYGSAWLIKTDTNGNQQWNKTFEPSDGARSIQQTSDGEYILVASTRPSGTNYEVWLIKTDTNGNQLWNKTFGGTNNQWPFSVWQTLDGGYIFAGETTSYGAGNEDAWLVKVLDKAIPTGSVHNVNKGTNYTTIQAAINDANPGDEIHVDSGTYNENVNVTKQLILKGIDTGGGKPIIDARGSGSAITLTANGVILEGFTATRSGFPDAGINVTSNNNTLSENNASNSSNGIYLFFSSNNTLRGNNVSNNYNGIFLYYSGNNTLKGNYANSNIIGVYTVGYEKYHFNNDIDITNKVNGKPVYYIFDLKNIIFNAITAGHVTLAYSSDIVIENSNVDSGDGIVLIYSSNNTLNNNSANSNNVGIELRASSNNTLNGNIATNNNFDIYLVDSTNNTLNRNIATNNNIGTGITLHSSSKNTLSGNNASNNSYGIYLYSSSKNTLSGNIASNNNIGITLDSSNNTISNNYFNNTNNFAFSGTVYSNVWNTTKQVGINIAGGPYLGGNFWAYPNGTGFSQTCTDSDADGICDSPYTLDNNNIDYLPLSYKLAVTPTPTLTVSPQSGQQGTIFQYSGNNYTPNGAIDWHVLKPDGTEYPVGSLTADNSGNLSYQYSSSCDSMVGSYTIWAIDRTTGKKSNNVTQTISAYPSCTVASSITVVSPNGGENWQAGSFYNIQWSYTGNPGSNVQIELLKSGAVDSTITSSTSIGSGGSGSYTWTIPSTQTAGTDYRIRITSTSNSAYTNTGDGDFSISAPIPTSIVSGKGIWIYKLYQADGGNINKIIERSKNVGIKWIALKCGDGRFPWDEIKDGKGNLHDQCTPSLIKQFQNAGIKVLGWQFVYGKHNAGAAKTGGTPIEEADLANKILDKGIDGFIIDAEGDYQGLNKEAVTYMENIRNKHPNSFIAYAPFPLINSHKNFPYVEFGKYSDAVMPQEYWRDVGRGYTPEGMIKVAEEQWSWNNWYKTWKNNKNPKYSDTDIKNSFKPMVPIGQGWNVPGNEIKRFCGIIYNHGYGGISLWEYAGMSIDDWDAYTECFTPTAPTSITVTSPNGGETWQAGTTQNIQWSYTGNPGSDVKIELLKGGGVNTIIPSAPIGSGGSGSYSWNIPPTQTPGTDYQIRITSTNNSVYTDTSDGYFGIITPTIPVLHLPLKGTPIISGFKFGDDWKIAGTNCGPLWKSHTGVDLSAKAGDDVYASYDGIVKKVYNAGTGWANGIVIEHTAPDNSMFTTTYIHVNPLVKEKDHVIKNQRIATIAKITGPHLHFGVRNSGYSVYAVRGALPKDNKYKGPGQYCKTDHPFPEYFIDPMKLNYEYN